MSARPVIEQQIQLIARELKKRLAPLSDDLVLLDSGLDSLCFAILVGRLEEILGVDPFMSAQNDSMPTTFGQLIAFYDRAMA